MTAPETKSQPTTTPGSSAGAALRGYDYARGNGTVMRTTILLSAFLFWLPACATYQPGVLLRELTLDSIYQGVCWQRSSSAHDYEVICGRGVHAQDADGHFIRWASAVVVTPSVFEEVLLEAVNETLAPLGGRHKDEGARPHGPQLPLAQFRDDADRRGVWSRLRAGQTLSKDVAIQIGNFEVVFRESKVFPEYPAGLWVTRGECDADIVWHDEEEDNPESTTVTLMSNGDLLFGSNVTDRRDISTRESWGIVRAGACAP